MADGPAPPGRPSPEVGHTVEGGLLVEDVAAPVHDDGAVHKVLHPVGPPAQVQSQVPVSPARHIVVEVLEAKRRYGGVGWGGVGWGGRRRLAKRIGTRACSALGESGIAYIFGRNAQR